jgi:murein DD-endopeptidase MepM/ murein hydrolase activator NlpD
MVTVEHYIKGKKVVSTYAHMSKIVAKKGDKVKAGEKIGEVGSTGNSTGNHLHLQIDLAAPFYPYYYDYKACPYSYYKISETGICFNELEKHSIDPLLFLETNGAVLDDYKVTQTETKNPSSNNTVSRDDFSIFTKTVYI